MSFIEESYTDDELEFLINSVSEKLIKSKNLYDTVSYKILLEKYNNLLEENRKRIIMRNIKVTENIETDPRMKSIPFIPSSELKGNKK